MIIANMQNIHQLFENAQNHSLFTDKTWNQISKLFHIYKFQPLPSPLSFKMPPFLHLFSHNGLLLFSLPEKYHIVFNHKLFGYAGKISKVWIHPFHIIRNDLVSIMKQVNFSSSLRVVFNYSTNIAVKMLQSNSQSNYAFPEENLSISGII